MTFATVFHELAAILMLAGVIGVVALKLRQPLIIGYILTGILVGPAFLGWASGGSELKLLSSVGIAVLLFVVGLKLDVGLIRSVGPVALATGLGQIVFTALFGFLIALALGFAPVKALYIAVCLTSPARSSSSSCFPTSGRSIPCTGASRWAFWWCRTSP